MKTTDGNSSSDAHNTGKNHNSIDTLSIGTEVPNFAHSQHVDQVQTQWECCMCETADSGLPSAPSRVAALCSALQFPVNKVQQPAANFRCCLLSLPCRVEELPSLTRKYSADSFFIFLDPPFLIPRSAKTTSEPENIFAAIVWHFARNSK